MGSLRARERKRLQTRVTTQPQGQSQDAGLGAGVSRMPDPRGAQSSCGAAAVGSDLGRSPLCPPALPTVSATPGTHVPCGTLTSLVLPSEETDGEWGLGDRSRVGARKQGQLWQGRERLAASICCVTLGSLSGLSGLGLL